MVKNHFLGADVEISVHQEFQGFLKWRYILNLFYKAILRVGKLPVSIRRIHTAYMGFHTSILGT